jgi:allantoinase
VSKSYDVLVRCGILATPSGERRIDVGIAGEKIVAIGGGLAGSAGEAVDATGLHLFAGVIDSHVHFNDPGRTDWEGVATGSRASAAGGGTTYFDMPLNSSPPTLDAESFDKKLAATGGQSVIDFGLWGGLTPNNLEDMEALAERGVVGFKAFMSNSGIEDFARADERTLREGMKRAAACERLVAVHAESEELTRSLTTFATSKGRHGARDYLNSRPIQAELDAIELAIGLAAETGCALHIVHVSSGAGVELVSAARKRGIDVTCETCPHYLVLTEEDVEKLGAVAKCAPPLRPDHVRLELWRKVANGEIQTIGSDHSPSPPDMKTGEDFFKIWGGISGVQHTLPLLITEAGLHQVTFENIAQLTALNVAKRFGVAGEKGALEIGKDADFSLVDLGPEFEVKSEDLLYRHRQSPYIGRKLKGRVKRTVVRGQTVFCDGKFVGEPRGRLIKPTMAPGRF